MAKAKRLILYDIDGTLLRTKGVGRDATKRAMLDVFGTCSTIDMHYFGGKTDWFTLTELLKDHGFDADTIKTHLPAFEQAAARYMQEAFDLNPESVYALPGAVDTVHRTRADEDTLIGIVTGNASVTAPVKLKGAGYDPEWFIANAYGSEAMDRNDLPPLALMRAVECSGWEIYPENVYVIGDTLADIDCARALGAVAVAVLTGSGTREELEAAAPDYLLEDMTALSMIL